MRVVDTSAWIEWLAATPTMNAIAPQLPPQAEWIIPSIVLLELTKYVARENGAGAMPPILSFARDCIVVPLDTQLALAAARVAAIFKLATADAVIYATAQHHGADLLTCDAHFKALDNVIYIAKKKP